MVKNVRNKIIISVASILLMAAAIVVYPYIENMAKAAGQQTYYISGKYQGSTDCTYTVTISEDEFYYSGQVQTPTIESISCDKSGALNPDDFKIVVESGNSTDVGTYNWHLERKSGANPDYAPGTTSNSYEIKKARLTITEVKTSTKIVKLDSSGNNSDPREGISKIMVRIGNGAEEEYKGDYTLTAISGQGVGKTTNITISGTTNYDEATYTVSNLIAVYDLKNLPSGVSVQFENASYSVGSTPEENYVPGTSYNAALVLSESGNKSSTGLQTTYELNGKTVRTVKDAGLYTVKLSPNPNVNSEYAVVSLGGKPYYVSGVFETKFKVKQVDINDTDELEVYYDPDGAGGSANAERIDNATPMVVLDYNGGSAVELKPEYCISRSLGSGGVKLLPGVDFTYECTGNVTKTGTCVLTITPIPGTAAGNLYSGSKEIYYFIKGNIKLVNYSYNGRADAGGDRLLYNGIARYVEFNRSDVAHVVTDVAGETGTQLTDTQYKLYYQYEDTPGNWLPADETAWPEADVKTAVAAVAAGTATDPQTQMAKALAKAGNKRVVIKGQGDQFGGQVNYHTYEITGVNMANDSTDGEFRVNISTSYDEIGAAYSAVYDGNEKRPQVKVEFRPKGESSFVTLTTDEYTVTYSNNVNAAPSTAPNAPTVTITAKDGSSYTGSLTKTFTIDKLSGIAVFLASEGAITAMADNNYTYTGSIVKPIIAIKENGNIHKLTEGRDYTVTDALGQPITTINVGNSYQYEINLLNANLHITTKPANYNIVPATLKPEMFSVRDEVWNGGTVPATVTSLNGLVEGEDYTVGTPTGNTAPGPDVAHVTVTGKGNYGGSVTLKYSITPRPINSDGITASASVGSYSGGKYPVTITVNDESATLKTLSYGTDYQVNIYKLNSEGRRGAKVTTTTAIYLGEAGSYEFEIEGIGKYTGVLNSDDLRQSCGYNLADYYVYITNNNIARNLRYTGESVTPGATYIQLRKRGEGEHNYTGEVPYTLKFYNENTHQLSTTEVGKIRVTAVGYGISYGETEVLAGDTDCYYNIVADQWKANKDNPDNYFKVTIEEKTYSPSNRTLPEINVYYKRDGGVTSAAAYRLTEGIDYEIRLVDEKGNVYNTSDPASVPGYLNAGTHEFRIVGIGNYADRYNDYPYDFEIKPAIITETWIKKDETVKYISDKLPYVVKINGTGATLEAETDYHAGSVLDVTGADSKKYRRYRIETIGSSNYAVSGGAIAFDVEIAAMDWASITIYDSAEECPVGGIYVSWEKSTLIFTEDKAKLDSDDPLKHLEPKFKLMVKHEKNAEELAVSPSALAAYEIKEYGRNNKAGQDQNTNLVKIGGLGGFTGEKSIQCTLYNPFTYTVNKTPTDEENELAKTGMRFESTVGDGTVLYPGANITQKNFREWYTSGTLEDHIKLNFNNGSRALDNKSGGLTLTSSDFKATVLNYSNTVGVKEILLTGKEEADNYFSGNFKFTVYTTGDLSDARVTIGTLGGDKIEYTAQSLISSNMNIQVTVGGSTLREGSDYDIFDIVEPSTGNIGQGTVTITGKGEYVGTKIVKDFYVVANLSNNPHIKYEIEGNDHAYHDYSTVSTSAITFGYQNEVTPGVKVWIERKGASGTYDEIGRCMPSEPGGVVSGSGFALRYSGNTVATDTRSAYINITPANGSYLTSSKQMSFIIAKTKINDAPVNIVSFEQNPMYTGSPMDPVNDLKLTLSDGNNQSEELVAGRDYTLSYDAGINYTDCTGRPIDLIIKGKGNYTGQRILRYEIQPRPLTATYFVVAQNVEMPYRNAEIPADVVGAKIQVDQNGDNILRKSLKYGTDFEISDFRDMHEASFQTPHTPELVGTYTIVLKGIGNYTSTQEIAYTITTLDLADIEIKLSDCICGANSGLTSLHCVYNGEDHKPQVEVKYQGSVVASDEYNVDYTNNKNAGTATVTVSPTPGGTSNFSGTKSVDFTIYPKSVSDLFYTPAGTGHNLINDNEIDPSYDFTGYSVQPGMTVMDREILTATGEYSALVAADDGSKDYKITYESTNHEVELRDGAPTCSYAGKVKLTVQGTGNYSGIKTFYYYIGRNIDKAYPVISGAQTEYNGLKQPPNITGVERNGIALEEREYTVVAYKRVNGVINKDDPYEVTELTDAAEYIIAVEGVPSQGTYTKNPEQNTIYNITARSISGAEVSGFDGMYYYTGNAICPVGIIVTDTNLPVSMANPNQTKSVQLSGGIDYTVEYKNNVAAGKATIVVTGKGNYKSVVYAYFTIDSSNISGGDGYDETSDGTGALTGGQYSISPSDVVFTYSTSGNNWMDYTGYSVRPSFTITQNGAPVPSSYFYVTLENSVNPGVATMVINGDGINLTGAIRKNYLIKADLARYGKLAPIEDQIYTGNQITPAVTVSVGDVVLREGVEYNVTYVNNTNMGTATAYATAVVANNTYYYGRLTGTFNISNAAGGMQVAGYASTYSYTGSPIAPDVSVTMNGVNLVKDRDYTVTYKNNTNVGLATIEVRGIGSYSGTKTITFNIQPKNIENCVASVVSNQSYTGQTYTPVISVVDTGTGKTLVSGSDYTLTYSNNTNPGTATITIQALGKNYTGSKVVNFKITSAPVTGLKFVSGTNHKVKISWTKQDYADGYQICNASNRVIGATKSNSITISGLSSAKTYAFKVRSYVSNPDGSVSYGDFSSILSTKTLLNTPKIKVDARGNGVVTVRWSKIDKASGYEIYYSTTKSGTYYKLANVSKGAKRIFNDKGLAKGEVYYYTIRAYRNVNGEKVYSGYSTITKVKVK